MLESVVRTLWLVLWEACPTHVLPLAGAVLACCPFAGRRRLANVGWLVAFILVDDIIGYMPLLLH